MSKRVDKNFKPNPEIVEKVVKRLESNKPRGARTTLEEKKREVALAEHIAGLPKNVVESKYALAAGSINRVIKEKFSSAEDFYDFLEGCMLQNSLAASARFAETAHEMGPAQAAAAAATLAKTAIEIRKARKTGFREEPVPVQILLKLQQALVVSKTVS